MHRRPIVKFIVCSLLIGLASGCGKDKPKDSQVAVKVNGDEVTVHQLNFALQRVGNVPEAQVEQARKDVLDRLIDQQLLVQQAVDKKLDREPRIVQAIEAARLQILAQAYTEQVMGLPQKPSETAVGEYYAQHPDLFQERRIFRFAQLAAKVPADKQPAVRARLEELDKQKDKSKSLLQLNDWMKAQAIEARVTTSLQPAEQLPLDALPKYSKMAPGDFTYAASGDAVVITQLLAAQTQPMTREQARPFIEQFLQNSERMRLSDAEMKRLRSAAKVEYVGEFGKLQKVGAVSPSVDPATPAPATPAGAKAEDPSAAGLKGLK